MAVIQKISIRGIRSFSPDREQTIEFYSPLTMIVGENGCGKTTIIECLKLACTGSLPPGSRNGQSFIHDPKISGVADVKASIKLRFKAKGGQPMVVIRSFQLSQKKTALTFKALDGVIRTKDDATGEKLSINHKCSELDKQVPNYIGVSAAIMENVIFCHQEESSWPLQEGAVVKKKFDDIFESSRYTKALDTIKKLKQEYALKVKELRADLEGLKAHKMAAENYESVLERLQEQYMTLKHEAATIDTRINELHERQKEYSAKSREVDRLSGKKQELSVVLRELEAVLADKERSLSEPSSDTDEELLQQLKSFDTEAKNNEDAVNAALEDMDACSTKAGELKLQKNRLYSSLGTARERVQEEKRLISERDEVVDRLSNRFSIFAGGGGGSAGGHSADGTPMQTQFSEADIAMFDHALQEHLAEKQRELAEKRNAGRQEMDDIQSEISKLQAEQRTAESSARAKEEDRKRMEHEWQVLHNELRTSSSVTRAEVDDARRSADAALQQQQVFEAKGERGMLERQIREHEKALKSLMVEVEGDREALELHNENMEDQTKVTALDKQVTEDTQRLEGRLADSKDRLSKYMTGDVQSASCADLEAAFSEIQAAKGEKARDLDQRRRDQMETRKTLAEKETILRQSRQEKSKLEIENADSVRVGGAVDAVREVIRQLNMWNEERSAEARREAEEEGDPEPEPLPTFGEDEPTEALAYLKLEERKEVEVTTRESGVGNWVKQFCVEGLKKGRCLACKRALETQEDRTALEKFMEKRAGNTFEADKARRNAALDSVRARIASLEKLTQGWTDFRRRLARLGELAKEIATHEEGVAAAEKERAAVDAAVEAEQAEVAAAGEVATLAQQLLDEATRIQHMSKTAGDLRQRLDTYVVTLGERTMAQVQADLKQHEVERERLTKDLQAAHRSLQQATAMQLNYMNKRSASEGEAKGKEEKWERDQKLKAQRDAAKARMETLDRELNDLRNKETPLRLELRNKEAQRERRRRELQAEEDRLQRLVNDCTTSVASFGDVSSRVAHSVKQDHQGQVMRLEADIDSTETRIIEFEQEMQAIEARCNQATKSKDLKNERRKAVQANLDIRRMRREREEQRRALEAVDADIEKVMGGEDLYRMIGLLQQEESKQRELRAGRVGRTQSLKEQMRETQARLATTEYKGVSQRCMYKHQEYTTTECAAHDLDKYWTALDKALLRFHSMKIADINKIIHELWQTVYSGQDIDMIEIVSGEEGESTKARRSYNYRVVMRKGSTVLDMKGRCSAGQRVLASLVIRLALAETFCINCGILALDEPTTNLDHNNKNGLADALAKIIAARSRQQNFQLVIITHDDDFVTTMRNHLLAYAGVSMPEYYYTISREEMGANRFFSRIDRHDWDEIAA